MNKIKSFMKSHQNIYQLIKFTLISCIAAVVEIGTVNLLGLLLKPYSQPVNWFIFNYTAENGGLGTMVAFLVSTSVAQFVSYITNRKATFHADNNQVFALTVYLIMVVFIILFQTWAGPVITIALNKTIPNYALCLNISKFSLMFLTFILVFVMDKFVIMRKTDKNKKATSSEVLIETDKEAALEAAADEEEKK